MSKIQKNNLEHSYFCEDMFSHFDKMNISKEETIKDFISVADGIIVLGKVPNNENYVVDFAKQIKMEVEYIEQE